jgi:hypothetical protein
MALFDNESSLEPTGPQRRVDQRRGRADRDLADLAGRLVASLIGPCPAEMFEAEYDLVKHELDQSNRPVDDLVWALALKAMSAYLHAAQLSFRAAGLNPAPFETQVNQALRSSLAPIRSKPE